MTFPRSLLYSLAAIALVGCGVANGQTFHREVQVPSQQPRENYPTGWYDAAPIRQVNDARLGANLSDIESHMPAGHIYKADGMGTWAHETTHGINSRLRMELGSGYNAFYVLGNKAFVLREPNVKITQVAQQVPLELRGDQYQLYLVSQAGQWNDNPLYVLDEWTAYINGCIVEQELYGSAPNDPQGFSIGHNVDSAIQFSAYATALLQVVEQRDPNYADKAKLAEFIACNIDRSLALTIKHPRPDTSRKFATVYFQGGWQECATGNCGRPQWQGQQWSRPQQPTKPPLVAVPPKPTTPAVSCSCKGMKSCSCDPKLAARVSELESQIAILLMRQPIAGPPGPAGPQGPKGDTGATQAIDPNELAKKLPPITFEIWDDGKLTPHGSRKVHLGGTVPFERYSIGGSK